MITIVNVFHMAYALMLLLLPTDRLCRHAPPTETTHIRGQLSQAAQLSDSDSESTFEVEGRLISCMIIGGI